MAQPITGRIIACYPEEYHVPHWIGNSKSQFVKDLFGSLYHLRFPPHSYFFDASSSFLPHTISRPEQDGPCPGPMLLICLTPAHGLKNPRAKGSCAPTACSSLRPDPSNWAEFPALGLCGHLPWVQPQC